MIRISKASGSNTDLSTSQAFIFPRFLPEDLKDKFILTFLISACGEDIFLKVKQISLSLEEKLSEVENKSLTEAINTLFEFIKEGLKEAENLNVLMILSKEDTLYLKNLGSSKAYLLREGKKVSLTGSQDQGQLVSGFLHSGDKVIMLSPDSLDENIEQEEKVFWSDTNIDFLINSDNSQFEEDFTSLMQRLESIEPKSAILVDRIEEEKKQERKDIPDLSLHQAEFKDNKKPRIKISLPSIRLPRINFRRKKVLLIFSLSILALILVIASLGFYISKVASFKSDMQRIINSAQDDYNQAQTLKDSDQAQAKEKIDQSLVKLGSVLAQDPGNTGAEALKLNIEQNTDSIFKKYRVSDWPVFLSLDLIRPDFNPTRFSYSINKLLMLDDKNKTLVSVNIANKNNQVLAGKNQIGDARSFSLNGDNAFVYSPDKGLSRIDLLNSKITVVAKPDESVGEISNIVAFAGNVYVVDETHNQIWKYIPTTTGYSDKYSYLQDGVSASLSGTRKMEIDYSVWILKGDADVTRFTAGREDFFSVGGIDIPISKISSFYVPDDGELSYFLDPDNSRLVVLKKNGQYDSQYIGDKFKTATDLAVDIEEKKIYLLEGGKIYQIDLK